MSAIAPPGKPAVHYPDSDGQPMADNSVQYRWNSTLMWNADAQFRDDPRVFVAGDHLIYSVQGDAKIRQAPDAYIAFGPSKGDRGSYKVWEEGGIFPQVVFEVWSPNNRYDQMRKKFDFYERYGAEEYYIIYPDFPAHVEAWWREHGKLVEIPALNNWVSPRLGWRFHLDEGELTVTGPDGRLLRDPSEIIAERDAAELQWAEAERQKAEAEQRKAEAERQKAEAEQQKAEAERQKTEAEQRKVEAERQRTEAEQQKAEAERQRDAERDRAAKLAAKLRELGIDPDAA